MMMMMMTLSLFGQLGLQASWLMMMPSLFGQLGL
jgi:hypothetical protein